MLSANGIVATTEALTSDLFQLIYVVPSGQYNKRWILYGPDLRNLVPSGYTAIEMSRPYSRGMEWEHERRVANDSYACRSPNCCLFNPKGFTACVTCGCKFTFEVVTGPSKVALPLAGSTVGNDEITAKEYEDYGFRVAKHASRAKEKRAYVYQDDWLLWRQVLRCLDWRMKWDLKWTREDNFNKLQKGVSCWRSGEQWERPSPTAFERMNRTPPVGIPGIDEFCERHRKCLEDKNQRDHAFLATVYTVGLMCDRLEAVFPNLIHRLQNWQKAEANDPIARQVYTRSPYQEFRLFGPRLWKILALIV